MAGARVNNYSPSTADLTSLMETVDGDRTGYIALSLTEYDSTVVPAIAGGSLVEVAGSLFRFSTTEAISTTGVTSTAAQMYYIRLVPTSSQCSAQFSTTVRVWREDLQGYYHSTTSTNRVAGETYFDGVDYTRKALYLTNAIQRPKTAIYVSVASTAQISTLVAQVTGFAKVVDTGNDWSTSANGFSPLSSGVYSIMFEIQTSSLCTLANMRLQSWIYKNGSTFKLCYNEYFSGSTVNPAIFNIQNSIIDSASSTDVYTFYVAETQSISTSLIKAASYSVSAQRLL